MTFGGEEKTFRPQEASWPGQRSDRGRCHLLKNSRSGPRALEAGGLAGTISVAGLGEVVTRSQKAQCHMTASLYGVACVPAPAAPDSPGTVVGPGPRV